MAAKVSWALGMAERGLPVFPVREGAKFPPLVEGWPDKATTDPEQIRSWWARWPDANIGVHCKDHIVIDVDVKNGKPGLQSLKTLDLDLNTLTVRTPTGGLHVYYSGPNVKNSVGALGPGLDIRSDHGYVLGPGSTTVEGSYKVNGTAYTRPIAASEDLCRRLSQGARNADLGDVGGAASSLAVRAAVDDLGGIPNLLAVGSEASLDRAISYLVAAPPAIEGQGGDQQTFKTAAVLKDLGVSEYTAWELMADHWNPRCQPPWDEDELQRKVQNAYRYGSLPPGVDTPEFQFQGIHIAPPARPGRQWFYPEDALDLDQSWLFHKLLPTTGVAVLVGPSGSGKTFVIAELGRCLGTGKAFFGVEPEARGGMAVLFAGTEGSGFAHRLAALKEPDGALPITFTYVSGLAQRGALDALLADLQAQKTYMQERYGVPLRVVTLETLSASGLIENENDNAQAAQAIANLNTISRALGILFIITHHPPKHGEGTRGADAIPSNTDYVLEINRSKKASVREITVTKARAAEERKLGAFSLVEVEIGRDNKGRPVTSMVISAGDLQAVVREKATMRDRLFIECIEHVLIDEDVQKVEIEGILMVRVEDVKAQYLERSKDKNPRNADRFVQGFLGKNLMTAQTAPYDGETYICLRETI